MKWDSSQYMKFQEERKQPAIDLAGRIPMEGYQEDASSGVDAADAPKKILDVGCGPGVSTGVLKARFPGAWLLGIDSSEDMIRRAREAEPDVEFRFGDAQGDLGVFGKFDVVFSNACLQWVPDHQNILPGLFGLLEPGGVLAVQIPKNWGASPLYHVLEKVVSDPKWGFGMIQVDYNGSLEPDDYFDILSSLTPDFTMWETVYYHRMPSHRSLVDWIRGTTLTRYTGFLDEEGVRALEDEIVEGVRPLYPPRKNGEIIYKIRRLFFIARKPARK